MAGYVMHEYGATVANWEEEEVGSRGLKQTHTFPVNVLSLAKDPRCEFLILQHLEPLFCLGQRGVQFFFALTPGQTFCGGSLAAAAKFVLNPPKLAL